MKKETMKDTIKSCTKEELKFNIERIIDMLKNNQLINFEIVGHPSQKEKFNLKIKYYERVKD